MNVVKTFGLFLMATSVLSGCSTSQTELLPTGESTMKEIWNHGASQDNNIATYRDQVTGRLADAPKYISHRQQASYTRDAENEAKNLFPRLPNPDLVMYIYPHLTNSAEQMPVPGYSSVIPFYGRVQYAQPGERTRSY
ncbi:TIGR03751 family conjugal transfer lipoprotein [Haemophilus sputorum]|uniref:TIGR03751 family conjugal transfer lipoprotein n=1 Tax=Haemophilus sputorum TaxID=1078480 RepID=A0A369YE72_9PAST|nr:TIGR03751 family conjugal transfer lipoprotein [Haemophilus sputorum]RDE70921.1 TIGR03751 family conjugal transfer lipoprotein [Haemophilus sputorum]